MNMQLILTRDEVEMKAPADVVASHETLRRLVGMHDPTGENHMRDAARLAEENDRLRGFLRRTAEMLKEWDPVLAQEMRELGGQRYVES